MTFYTGMIYFCVSLSYNLNFDPVELVGNGFGCSVICTKDLDASSSSLHDSLEVKCLKERNPELCHETLVLKRKI